MEPPTEALSLSNSNSQDGDIADKKFIPPITLLQDICSRNGFHLESQLLSTEGSVHEPTFKIAITVDNITVTASGHSKKKAKHAAAREAIDRLRLRNDLNFEDLDFNALDLANEAEPKTSTNSLNPVGKLQEFCMKMRVNPPEYETCEEQGLAHERVFRISCQIVSLKLVTLGEGRSKKLAKRDAAQTMLEKLVDMQVYEKSVRRDNTNIIDKKLLVDQGDGFHLVRHRGVTRKTSNKLKLEEETVTKILDLWRENECDDELLYRTFEDMISRIGRCQYRHLTPTICFLHLIDEENILFISTFGSGSDKNNAKRDAVIRVFELVLLNILCSPERPNLGICTDINQVSV